MTTKDQVASPKKMKHALWWEELRAVSAHIYFQSPIVESFAGHPEGLFMIFNINYILYKLHQILL